MRKICSSAKTSWRRALRARALARSWPNGFSRTIRARSVLSPASAIRLSSESTAFGGTLR